MTHKRIVMTGFAVSVVLSGSAHAEDSVSAWSGRAAENVEHTFEFSCDGAKYSLRYETNSVVKLSTFDSEAFDVSPEAKGFLANKFSKFKSLSYLVAWCGEELEQNNQDFVVIEFGGIPKECADAYGNVDDIEVHSFLVGSDYFEFTPIKRRYCTGEKVSVEELE